MRLGLFIDIYSSGISTQATPNNTVIDDDNTAATDDDAITVTEEGN